MGEQMRSLSPKELGISPQKALEQRVAVGESLRQLRADKAARDAQPSREVPYADNPEHYAKQMPVVEMKKPVSPSDAEAAQEPARQSAIARVREKILARFGIK